MDIAWKGLFCFLIKAQGKEAEKVRILIHPFFNPFKKRPGPLAADIVLRSFSPEASRAKEALGQSWRGMKTAPFLIDGPGEYEVKGIFVQGVEGEGGTIYRLEAEGLSLCHLAAPGKGLTPGQIEEIGEIDILMVPVGGEVLDPEKAVDIVSQLEPRMVLPMNYWVPGLKEDWNKKLAKIDRFLEALGVEEPKSAPNLKIRKEKLPPETEILILELNG
jgi:L-ascorbate metabolism protein UlaG (beta-lactamase superfamily)